MLLAKRVSAFWTSGFKSFLLKIGSTSILCFTCNWGKTVLKDIQSLSLYFKISTMESWTCWDFKCILTFKNLWKNSKITIQVKMVLKDICSKKGMASLEFYYMELYEVEEWNYFLCGNGYQPKFIQS